MPRFRLEQIEIQSLGKYFLPLPKLGSSQLATLSAHLRTRGLIVRAGSTKTRLTVTRGSQRILVDGHLGLAWSSEDMLDTLAPSIPALLEAGRVGRNPSADVSALYYSLRRSGSSTQVLIFPRLESLRTWTYLRAEGLCGLTPDEAAALSHVLKSQPGGSKLECITTQPKAGSARQQFGRKVYYRSKVDVEEFLQSLRTIDSGTGGPFSYVPRNSVIELGAARIDSPLPAERLGDWCLAS